MSVPRRLFWIGLGLLMFGFLGIDLAITLAAWCWVVSFFWWVIHGSLKVITS